MYLLMYMHMHMYLFMYTDVCIFNVLLRAVAHPCNEATSAMSVWYDVFGLKLQVQNRACTTLTVFSDSDWAGENPRASPYGFLLSVRVRTQSVIAQSSCEAEYIAATAATSGSEVHPRSVLCLWTTREYPSAFRQTSKVPGLENANTKFADRSSPDFWRMRGCHADSEPVS